jgi:hypothetical protein
MTEVVHHEHFGAAGEKLIHEGRADKARASRHRSAADLSQVCPLPAVAAAPFGSLSRRPDREA